MYYKHLTEGIVVRNYDRGDSSNTLSILTRNFGLIFVTVQNARSLNSKLRYSIQEFSKSNFSLVKGKNSWKLVGAESISNFWFESPILERFSKVQVLRFASRFAVEERNDELYKGVVELIDSNSEDEMPLKEKELLSVLTVLRSSGFLKESFGEIKELVRNPKMAVEVINSSIKASGI